MSEVETHSHILARNRDKWKEQVRLSSTQRHNDHTRNNDDDNNDVWGWNRSITNLTGL